MKRVVTALLCAALLLSTACPALAAENTATGSLRTSVYCSSASMAANRALFTEAEWFGSSAPLTRAMTAVILARIDGASESAPGWAPCADIDVNAWYAFGAVWGCESGVLPAADDGLFHPEQILDRVTLCVVLAEYFDYLGVVPEEINTRYSFMEAGTLDPEPRQDVALIQQAGILIEEPDGFFYPNQTVTVSEAESVFLRLLPCVPKVSFPTLPVATVEASDPVDDTWFDDVCFIGHSQVVGMRNNFDLYNAEYLAEVGFLAADMLVHKAFHMFSGRYGSLKRLLEDFSFGKVYIMLGINDCNGHPNMIEEFRTPMRQILDIVKETQPDATIYLISLAPVGRSVAYPTIYNPENTILFSQIIKELSREYDTEYLDLFRLLADEDGYMKDEYAAADGIHIRKEAYPLIKDYIKCHTVP